MDFLTDNIAVILVAVAGLIYFTSKSWLPLIQSIRLPEAEKRDPKEEIFYHWNQLQKLGCQDCKDELNELLPRLLNEDHSHE